MKMYDPQKSVMDKKIPTFVGIFLLVAALISGLIFFKDGTGVFAPRATPQTKPKNQRVTNVTDTSFTVSFYTDEETTAFVKYGQESSKLNSQAGDDRDQLSGSVKKYRLHHITIRGLDPNQTYYYIIGTGSNSRYDNEGQPFTTKTAVKTNDPPPEARTVYGSVSTAGGTPAEGSIVYLSSPEAGAMSSLVKASGSWAIPLSKARTKDGKTYAQIKPQDKISLLVQGNSLKQTIEFATTVEEAQPVKELSFGQDQAQSGGSQQGVDLADTSATNAASDSATTQASASAQASESAQVASGSAGLNSTPSPTLAPTNLTPSPTLDPSNNQASGSAGLNPSQSEDPISGRLQELLEEAGGMSTASAVLSLDDAGLEDSNDGADGASGDDSDGATGGDDTEQEPAVTTTKPKIQGKAKPNVQIQIEVHSDNNIQTSVTADENGEFTLDLEALGEELEPGDHTVNYSYIDPDTGEEVQESKSFTVEDPNQVQLTQATNNATNDTDGTDTSNDSDIPYGSGNPYPMSTPSPTPSETQNETTSTPTPTSTNYRQQQATPTPAPTSSTGTRSAQIDTKGGEVYKAGSVDMTLAMVIGGLFLIFAGSWSWWLAKELEVEK
jgi:hypothetical protein